MWTTLRLWLGELLIRLHIPGIIVNQSYKAEITQANVRVRLGPLFSVVTVNVEYTAGPLPVRLLFTYLPVILV